MSPINAFNIGVEAVCFLVTLVLFFLRIFAKRKSPVDRWYLLGLAGNLGLILGDISDWACEGQTSEAFYVVNKVGGVVTFLFTGVLIVAYVVYVATYVKGKSVPVSKWYMRATMLLLLVQTILSLLNFFFPVYFYIAEGNIYTRGPLFMVSPILLGLGFILVIILLVKGWKKFNRTERILFIFFLALPIIGEVLQAFFGDFAFTTTTTTLVFLVIISLLESETSRQLSEAGQKAVEQIIIALSNSIEAKDRYTNGHSRRVAEYAKEIVRRMGYGKVEQSKAHCAGLLHDVGKIRIPDGIINKTGKLTDEEYEDMKLHPLSGYYLLREVTAVSDFADGARWHHERFDGRGYPTGLKAEDIPFIARVIGVADAYDAMTSNRSYRDALPQAVVRAEIEKGMGAQFDPEIAKVMLQIIDDDKNYELHQKKAKRKTQILIIDEDEKTLNEFAAIFNEDPSYVFSWMPAFSSGHDAIKKDIDVVIFASQTAEDIASHAEMLKQNHPELSFIVLSSEEGIAPILEAESLGAYALLQKPLNPVHVKETLWYMLRDRNG
ncbi:MAG: HD domain-containing protein [Bacilli bacterium]|nr:HD domain-containing protein [Bacilli bacterium]